MCGDSTHSASSLLTWHEGDLGHRLLESACVASAHDRIAVSRCRSTVTSFCRHVQSAEDKTGRVREVEMVVTKGDGGTVPGAIMPSHYQHLGKKQAKAEFATSYANGWEYDPEAMKEAINALKDIRQGRLDELERLSRSVTGIVSPGNEEVSIGYTDRANYSGQTYKGLLESSIYFLDSYVDTLVEIDKAYQQQDEEALKALRDVDV